MKKHFLYIVETYISPIKKYITYPKCKLCHVWFLCLYLIMVLTSGYFVYLYWEQQNRESQIFISYPHTYDFSIEKTYIETLWDALFEVTSSLSDFDYISDESYQKYVDPDIPFENLWYIPPDLRSLSLTYITDTRGDLRLRESAAIQLEMLAEDFYNHFWEKVVVVSSYRSYERQRQIKVGWCPDHLCAKAWYSEHQGWLAVDFWSASTEAYWKWSPRLMRFYDWLYDNAHLYGYHNSYQNGVEIDGYAVEPWHWRYLWVELATYLRENEITFAEFFYGLDN